MERLDGQQVRIVETYPEDKGIIEVGQEYQVTETIVLHHGGVHILKVTKEQHRSGEYAVTSRQVEAIS